MTTTWTWVTSSPTEPRAVVGIDPSLRHTGLALHREGEADVYHEIKTGSLSVTESLAQIRTELVGWVASQIPVRELHTGIVWAIERQLPQGEVNGWLTVSSMLAVCSSIALLSEPEQPVMIAPYPNQLKSYITRVHGVRTGSKNQIRQGHKKITGGKLVSSHKAEAWFLTQMAVSVLAGEWKYEQSPTAPRLFPWPIVYRRAE